MNTMQAQMSKSRITAVLESRWFLPACLVLAFVLRLVWVLNAHTSLMTDWKWYYERATDLANGDGFIGRDGLPTAYFPVGWPATLGAVFSVTGPSIFAGQMTNIIIYMGLIVVSYLLAKDLFESRRTGALTAFALAVYPNHIGYSSILVCETQYTFLMLLGVLLINRARHRIWVLATAGVVLGLSTLTREQGYLVPLIAAIVFARRDRRLGLPGPWLRSGVVVVLASVLTILPWSIRNYYAFGHFVPVSTNVGINMWIGNNPYQTGTNPQDRKFLGEVYDEDDPQNELEWDLACRKHAIRYVLHHPLHAVSMWPVKFWHTYYWDWDGVEWGTPNSPQAKILRVICRPYYFIVMILFAVALFIRFARRKLKGMPPFPTIGLWLMGYWLFGNLLMFGYPRYHYAAMPWIIMYVAALFCSSYYRPQLEQEQRTTPAAAGVLRAEG